MISNAVLLRQALAYLDLNGKGLAGLISACRDDGKATAPETVSRWLTGINPVDPAVIGWMTELVRAKALARGGAVMKWPTRQSLTIAVANLKGGVGTTTVSHNLAFIASDTFKLDTQHIAAGVRSDTLAAGRVLEALRVPTETLSYEEALAFRPRARQVVVFDVARDVMYGAGGSSDRSFLSRLQADVIVVPADYGSFAEADSSRQFLDTGGMCGLVRLLHRPRYLQMDFAAVAAQAGLDVVDDVFYPSFIPQSASSGPHLPQYRGGEWRAPEQHHHFTDFFIYLVEQTGGELASPYDAGNAIASMSLAELLDFLGQAV
jgi:hypothetical protein